ncbi:MAG: tRNA pseudouridine(55) synthase TruB [Hyphomicrobiales bacterium]|nr:tRNA pseudouridine(55) synthase TruB [Hyphomicrobiales bacterium]
MGRRSKGRPVHGWLVLDKPQGLTSTKAVSIVKRLADAAKAGHAGTLDPLATGVLPIAFGEATKTVPFVVDGTKSYRFTVAWGSETTTDDAEGEVLEESAARPGRADVEGALPAFTGEILQVPPHYSAVKVEGQRAYDLARDGEAFELKPRPVLIERLALVEHDAEGSSVLEADCGKGTYVRALARDLGRRLGCFGHVSVLRRTRVGPFTDSQTISLAKLQEMSHSAAGREAVLAALKPVETALDDIPALAVSGSDAARLKRGQAVLMRGRDAPILEGPVYAMSRGLLVALGEVQHGELRPTRVFNLQG